MLHKTRWTSADSPTELLLKTSATTTMDQVALHLTSDCRCGIKAKTGNDELDTPSAPMEQRTTEIGNASEAAAADSRPATASDPASALVCSVLTLWYLHYHILTLLKNDPLPSIEALSLGESIGNTDFESVQEERTTGADSKQQDGMVDVPKDDHSRKSSNT